MPFDAADRPRAPEHPNAPVTAAGRLAVEHVVVHDLLLRLDQALVAMVTNGAEALPPVQAAVERLSDALLDHLAYEEQELLPALARLGTPV